MRNPLYEDKPKETRRKKTLDARIVSIIYGFAIELLFVILCIFYNVFIFGTIEVNTIEASPWVLILLGSIVILVLTYIFRSLFRMFYLSDKTAWSEFYSTVPDEKIKIWARVRSILKSKLFWLKLAPVGVFTLFLPAPLYYGNVLKLIGGKVEHFGHHVLYTLILLCIIFAASLLGALSAEKFWTESRKILQNRVPDHGDLIKNLISQTATIVVVYSVGVMAALFALSMCLTTIVYLSMAMPWFVGIIVALIVFLFILGYYLAIVKRKKFFKNLRKICAYKNITLSKVKNPYRSIFIPRAPCVFSIMDERGDMHDCRMITGIFKQRNVYLFSDGMGYVEINFALKGMTLYTGYRKFKYDISGNNKKILIVLPSPQKLFVTDGSNHHLVDSGDKVGQYRIFGGTGFINAVDVDCLDRETNS